MQLGGGKSYRYIDKSVRLLLYLLEFDKSIQRYILRTYDIDLHPRTRCGVVVNFRLSVRHAHLSSLIGKEADQS